MAITVMQWAQHLLLAPALTDKILALPKEAPMGAWDPHFIVPPLPGRLERHRFSDDQMKFPKGQALATPDGKARALHSFANHELLAIEMMATALLRYPHDVQDAESYRYKWGIVAALKDEQRHFGMYLERMREVGSDFGDFALNDFFWKQTPKLTTAASFFALMSLTFESANLDFARHYSQVFSSFGDRKTAGLLQEVYDDELTHVACGAHWLGKWRGDKNLWEYYLSVLPPQLSPGRAKGLNFHAPSRVAANIPQEWIEGLEAFEDPFRITRRRQRHDSDPR